MCLYRSGGRTPACALTGLPLTVPGGQRISLCLLVDLHAVPIGFRDVEAIVPIERDRHRPPEIRLGLGRDVVGRVKVRRQGREEV